MLLLEMFAAAFLLGAVYLAWAAGGIGKHDAPVGLLVFLGVVMVGCGGALIYADGWERANQAGCPVFNRNAWGLDKGVPYRTVGQIKNGAKIYAFVRLVESAPSDGPIRCIYSPTDLPPIFSVGSDGKVISLSTK